MFLYNAVYLLHLKPFNVRYHHQKNIDDCRDILVGKLPNPKAQIEQITIGLIYKFMDDMDQEAVELGRQAKFFCDY